MARTEVLVKHAAQTIPAQYRSGIRGCGPCLPRGALSQSLVSPGFLVVLDELPQHVLEVAATKDQTVIEELAPCSPRPSFGAGVRPRPPIGQSNDIHTLGPEDLIEASGEL